MHPLAAAVGEWAQGAWPEAIIPHANTLLRVMVSKRHYSSIMQCTSTDADELESARAADKLREMNGGVRVQRIRVTLTLFIDVSPPNSYVCS